MARRTTITIRAALAAALLLPACDGDAVFDMADGSPSPDGAPDGACGDDCAPACTQDDECDDGDPCNGAESCSPTLGRCQAGLPQEDLTPCPLPDSEEGACLSGRCGAPCALGHECDDGNACNGIETCDFSLGFCRPGPAPDCDDGERCTEDHCDPAAGCVHVLLHDEDGDGYASVDADCDDPDTYGGDCDDANPDVHPGAPEICGNGIDDNCNGEIDENKITWYLDCDGDGYAADTNGARAACTQPPTDGACTWTALRPVDPSTTDCDDATGFAHPGGNATFGLNYPYCVGTGQLATGTYPSWSCPVGAHWSWDFDCNGVVERRLTDTSGTICVPEGDGCASAAWTGSTPPACGQEAEVQSCGAWGGDCGHDNACLLDCIESGAQCCSCTCMLRQTCR
jgi:hypothetical protein